MSHVVSGGVARCRLRAVVAAGVVVVALLAAAVPAAAGAGRGAGFVAAAAAAPVPVCGGRLVAGGVVRLGVDAVRVTVVNEGPGRCVLRGHPTVALAGQGAPGSARVLIVVREGPVRPVVLPVGGAAQTRVAFVPVLGEAGGYCASGGVPFVAPSMVVGVAGARLQVALDDGGNFAVCGSTVRATAFRPAP
ncbi:DUF4232 domain-containing protein [Streptomyces erythrochromogenes]|uniref:DUF4232 domain-containing protein n=1 Tax=Streptomyces erythrochromogenes TaxID=285574 RepID=UPI0036A3548E